MLAARKVCRFPSLAQAFSDNRSRELLGGLLCARSNHNLLGIHVSSMQVRCSKTMTCVPQPPQTLKEIPQGAAKPKSPVPARFGARAANNRTTAVSVHAQTCVKMVCIDEQMDEPWTGVSLSQVQQLPSFISTKSSSSSHNQQQFLGACKIWPASCGSQVLAHGLFNVRDPDQLQVTAAPSICSWFLQLLETGCKATAWPDMSHLMSQVLVPDRCRPNRKRALPWGAGGRGWYL